MGIKKEQIVQDIRVEKEPLLYINPNGINIAVNNLTTETYPATITEGAVSSVTDEMTILGNASFTVSCDIACVVAWTDDNGETYHRLYGENVGTNTYKFTLPAEARKSGVTVSVGVKGDPTNQGAPDSTNAFQIQLYAHGRITFTAIQQLLSDVNVDGVVNEVDAELVQEAEIEIIVFDWDIAE